MSWYGQHPKIERDQISRRFPGVCKHCIYWLSVAVGTNPDQWSVRKCPRCGYEQKSMLETLNREKDVVTKQEVLTQVAFAKQIVSRWPKPSNLLGT